MPDIPENNNGASAPIVVIGAGLAGYGVLRELRKLDKDAPLTLVTADRGHFYSKPMLSTALAKGKTAETLVSSPAEKMTAQLNARLLAGVRVSRVRPAEHRIETSAGDLVYSKLVLALGADPVRLKLQGDGVEEVVSVNDLEAYNVFRRKLQGMRHVAIMGAGLVGCEFANDLILSGAEATLIDPLAAPMAMLLPPEASEGLRAALASKGVRLRLGAHVAAVNRAGSGLRLSLSDGSTVDADLVLSAAGLRPHIALASEAGLRVHRGIVVDACGTTSDPDISAIGDCAEYPVGLCAYVTPIMAAARAIAATALGVQTAIKFPVLSVQVKTTVYPIALLKPPEGAAGVWRRLEEDADGLKLGYFTASDTLVGYVLTGKKCDGRAAMDEGIAARLAGAAALQEAVG